MGVTCPEATPTDRQEHCSVQLQQGGKGTQIKFERFIFTQITNENIDGLVQESHNSSALAMELCLSCTNTSLLYVS